MLLLMPINLIIYISRDVLIMVYKLIFYCNIAVYMQY